MRTCEIVELVDEVAVVASYVEVDQQFGDGDGDGGDDGFFRKVSKELYDAKAIQAVLQVGLHSK